MHWSSVGYHPRSTGTMGVAEAAVGGSTTPRHIQSSNLTLEGDRGKDELSGPVQPRRGRACGAAWERCHSCETRSYLRNSLTQTASPGSAPRLQTLLCAFLGSCTAPGDSSFQGKVWVHTPSTLNTVHKATTENPKQQIYELGEVKMNCCVQDTTSEAGEGKCTQTFLASAKDQPDLQSWSLLSFLLWFFFLQFY